MLRFLARARSSAGERSPHTREVAGSKPAAPTIGYRCQRFARFDRAHRARRCVPQTCRTNIVEAFGELHVERREQWECRRGPRRSNRRAARDPRTRSRGSSLWIHRPDVEISFALREIEQRAEFADVDREPGTGTSYPKADGGYADDLASGVEQRSAGASWIDLGIRLYRL